MRTIKRLTVTLLATLLALLGWVQPAQAVGNPDAAGRAARYVAAQAPATGDAAAAADSLLALAAAGDPALAPQAGQLLASVQSDLPTFVAASPDGAAKLALVAVALGQDPRSFHGTDLVAAVKAGIRADGTFGQYPDPGATGLAMIALTRAQEQVPQALAQSLVRSANADGGFGPGGGRASEPDDTALAILGMLTQTDSISARDAVERAVVWATAQQQADGSWKSATNPVSATALLGSALQAAGQAQPRAVQFLVAQQLPDGALPDGGQASLTATQHAALLLGDTSYLTVNAAALGGALTLPGAGPSAAPSAEPSAEPTSAAPVAPTTTAVAEPTAAPVAPPAAAPRTDSIGALGVILLILLLLLLAGAAWLMFGRQRHETLPPPLPEPSKPAPAASGGADAPVETEAAGPDAKALAADPAPADADRVDDSAPASEDAERTDEAAGDAEPGAPASAAEEFGLPADDAPADEASAIAADEGAEPGEASGSEPQDGTGEVAEAGPEPDER